MKSSRWLVAAFLLLQLAASDAFFLSLGLVGIGVAGLAGLKLYYGMKMLAPMVRNAGMHSFDQMGGGAPSPMRKHAMLSPIFRAIGGYNIPKEEIQDEEEVATAENGDQKPVVLVPVVPVDPDSASKSTPPPTRTRRALPGGMKVSGDLFRWLAKIDDDLCIHRYFCDLGAKPRSFGNLGRLTNMLVMMGGLPDDGWAFKMHRLGQQNGQSACPVECNEEDLQRTVSYMERHIFETEEATGNRQNSGLAGVDRPPVLDIED